MRASAAEVQQLRSQLESRFGRAIVQPAPREHVPGFSFGVAVLDGLLPEGVPRGALTLLVGEATAGRTAALRALVARACTEGARVALVDASRTLDAAFGCTPAGSLPGLWVARPPGTEQAKEGAWAAEALLRAGVFDLVILDGYAPEPAQLHRLRLLAKEAGAALLITTQYEGTTVRKDRSERRLLPYSRTGAEMGREGTYSPTAKADVRLEFHRLGQGRGLRVGGRFRRRVQVRAVRAGAGAFPAKESEVEIVHEPANRLHTGAPAPDRRPAQR